MNHECGRLKGYYWTPKVGDANPTNPNKILAF